MDNFYTVLITAITVLGGSTAWRYYERRAIRKERDDEFIRNDCRERIAKFEALLRESSEEKDEMRELILQLTEEVAELRTKFEYLSKENEKLKTSKQGL